MSVFHAVLVEIRAQSDEKFYRRKKSDVVVRHVSDGRIAAMLEIVSPGKTALLSRPPPINP